ncbi:MAG TPA: hypothetical protein VH592_25155 [Gemmataceae bacterium]|jgi:hypothetical protein
MTEAEWLSATEPTPMLDFLRGKASDRKLRLVAVACCRRIWRSFTDECSRRAIEVAEQFADEKATIEELGKACISARQAVEQVNWDVVRQAACATAWLNISSEISGDSDYNSGIATAMDFAVREVGKGGRVHEAALENKGQTDLLREIIGNPFRPVSLDPAWLTWNDGTIPKLAQVIYDERAFDRLPILADALEESSCDNADVLGHCRQPGNHVRGCWVIDLILGKE